MASKLQLTQLDFDGIKQSLKDFLSSQTEFSDYDFEGSGLSVLLDILSYNTHYLGYYLNMVANEMFLDSADFRESVVSLAKQLNYTPRSRHAAEAEINFTIIPGVSTPPATIVVEKNTKFTTAIDGVSYIFVTDVAHTVDLDINTNTYQLANITLREGLPFTFRYTVDTSIPNQRFLIPNANVDTGTITVRVQNSATDTTITVYQLADDINELDGTQPVYFIQEVEDELYQVYFGNGVLGKALENGNIIIIDYLACNADAPNKAATFTAAQTINGFGNIQVTTVNAAFGGAEREDIDEVKFSAPKNYEAQNRAVTVTDYKTILQRDYPNVDSLAVWGGEDNVPPVYGKVFIALKPKSGFVVTELTKQTVIANILKKKNVVTVIPEIIDPDYVFLEVNSIVKYNPDLTTLTAEAIKALVFNTINTFSISQIGKFERIFKYSNLVTSIDETDPSITNDITQVKMQKRFVPTLNLAQTVTLDFNINNPITPGSVSSSRFVSNAVGFSVLPGDVHGIDDDGLGKIRIFKVAGTNKVVVKTNAGTVDYTTGVITLNAFTPSSIVDAVNYIKVSVVPQILDVTPVRSNIVTIDPPDIKITMETSDFALE